MIQCVAYWPFHSLNLKDFICDITLLSPKYGFGWFLNYLLIWYIIFYVIKRVSWLNRNRYLVLFICSVAVYLAAPALKCEQSFSFMAGVALSEFGNQEQIKERLNWKTGVTLILIGSLCFILKQTEIVQMWPEKLQDIFNLLFKLPAGFGLCLILISLKKKIHCKLFSLIGIVSYEFYLVHGYVLYAVPISVMGELIFMVGSIGAALALHWIVGLIKKPYRKLLLG